MLRNSSADAGTDFLYKDRAIAFGCYSLYGRKHTPPIRVAFRLGSLLKRVQMDEQRVSFQIINGAASQINTAISRNLHPAKIANQRYRRGKYPEV